MVVVFGSINVDLVTRVERFPRPGETIAGGSFALYAGGKGANQALAAARAGASVQLYGAVGRDPFADLALDLLDAGGVGLGGVARVAEPTGCASILVDAQAENCIVVAPGANARVDAAAVPDAALTPATTLVLQHEVPERANAALSAIDVLVLNETEAAALAVIEGWPNDPARFARAGAAAYPRLTVAVTLGARGAVACQGTGCVCAAPPAVEAIDTTGAGDAFVGVLAATLDAGAGLRDALARAVAAGTLACTMRGAQPSLPRLAAIDTLLPLVRQQEK